MLFTELISYFTNLFKQVKINESYGSKLERYIASKNPQSTYDVEYWENQFDRQQFQKVWPL